MRLVTGEAQAVIGGPVRFLRGASQHFETGHTPFNRDEFGAARADLTRLADGAAIGYVGYASFQRASSPGLALDKYWIDERTKWLP